MHDAAYQWVARHATTDPVAVLDAGGRNINGSPRDLFPAADPYVVLDVRPGDGVDIVADAALWSPDREYDVVVCCEVFEHTDVWPQICEMLFAALRPGGMAILTMAGPGREPHSALDGGPMLHDGEYYANVAPGELQQALESCGFTGVVVDYQPAPADTRAVAFKPEV
jgi:hypothetical protein